MQMTEDVIHPELLGEPFEDIPLGPVNEPGVSGAFGAVGRAGGG